MVISNLQNKFRKVLKMVNPDKLGMKKLVFFKQRNIGNLSFVCDYIPYSLVVYYYILIQTGFQFDFLAILGCSMNIAHIVVVSISNALDSCYQ